MDLMDLQFILPAAGFLGLVLGSVLGYFARQTVARRQAGTLEEKVQKAVVQSRKDAAEIVSEAKEKAKLFQEEVEKEIDGRKRELLKTEQLLLQRESGFDRRISELERKEMVFAQRVAELKKLKINIEALRKEAE